MERFIHACTPYVRALSRRFMWQEDAVQAGLMALVMALARFDPGRGAAFFTYATPWVLGEMRKAGIHSRHWRKTRIISCIRREQQRIRTECLRDATWEELCRAVHVDGAELALLMDSIHPLTPEDDMLSDPEGEKWMENLLFRDMLSRLAPEEKQLLHLRYVEGKKQKEAAEILHTSQSGVSRMENHLMKSLYRMWAE